MTGPYVYTDPYGDRLEVRGAITDDGEFSIVAQDLVDESSVCVRVTPDALPGLVAAMFQAAGLNTDAMAEDATIRRVIAFSRSWNAGGIIVANLFGLRSPRPRVLYVHDAPEGPDNDRVLSWVLSVDHEPVGQVVAAWGIHGLHRGRGAHVTRLLQSRGTNPVCLGTTKGGHPRHPLYLQNGTPAIPFTQPAEVA